MEFKYPNQCELCDRPAEFVDSIPDSHKRGVNLNECGYRPQLLCWIHATERSNDNTSRVKDLIVCEFQKLLRVDAGMASKHMICHECYRSFLSHKNDSDHPYLTVLCDGSLVKL